MGDDDDTGRHGGEGSGLAVHAVVFVAVNLLLIAVWGLFTKGADFSNVPDYLTHPAHARDADFFPLYVLVFWGAGLLIHAGVFSVGIPRRRRKRRERARRARQRRKMQAKVVGVLGDGLLGEAAVTGIKIVDGDKAAAKVRREAERERQRRPRRAPTRGTDRRDGRHADPAPPNPADPPSPAAVSRTDGETPGEVGADGAPTTFDRRADDRDGARHWMAVMFTDIVDSTPLTEHFGDDEWARLLTAHRALVRACIADHRGTEVGTQGDGFLVRFDTPDDAVEAAIAVQQRLAADREATRNNGVRALHVRIGIHAGEVVRNDDDLVGRVINLAARVTSAAEADEILVTEPLADHLTGDHPLMDRGLQTLKGFDRPRHLLALAWQPVPDEVDLRD